MTTFFALYTRRTPPVPQFPFRGRLLRARILPFYTVLLLYFPIPHRRTNTLDRPSYSETDFSFSLFSRSNLENVITREKRGGKYAPISPYCVLTYQGLVRRKFKFGGATLPSMCPCTIFAEPRVTHLIDDDFQKNFTNLRCSKRILDAFGESRHLKRRRREVSRPSIDVKNFY